MRDQILLLMKYVLLIVYLAVSNHLFGIQKKIEMMREKRRIILTRGQSEQ